MLEITDTLPEGVLLGNARAQLREAMESHGALWFEGGESAALEVDHDGQTLIAWDSGAQAAYPVEPNKGNASVGVHGAHRGLQCRKEVNCGFVLEGITENASVFSMAVAYLPPAEGDARTLLCLNTGYAGGDSKAANYVFLSDIGGHITAKDTRGAVEIVAPVEPLAPGQPRLLCVSLCGRELAIAEGTGPVVGVEGADPGMRAPGDLFIGCRSHRRGLKKTLGGACLLDVIFWPDRALLLPRSEEERRLHRALQRYYTWEY